MATANFVTDITEIATQAVEAAGAIASGIQSMRILELSKDYYNLYKRQRDFYYTTFKQGVETSLAAYVGSTPKYNLNYAGRVATLYSAQTGPLGGKSGNTGGWWDRHAHMYGDERDPRITKEFDADIARLHSDWTNYMFRYEEVFADTYNDRRWQQRLVFHNIGLHQGSNIASALDGSLGQYQNHIQDFGNVLATYGNGFAKYAGYRKGIEDVSDRFTTGATFQHSPVTMGLGESRFSTTIHTETPTRQKKFTDGFTGPR